MRVTLQELENEKQIVSISNSELKRNIGDRDATAEQLLNKVMTLQLKLEEKMFAESMMARARQRTRSKRVGAAGRHVDVGPPPPTIGCLAVPCVRQMGTPLPHAPARWGGE
jgi:hypothetical protein